MRRKHPWWVRVVAVGMWLVVLLTPAGHAGAGFVLGKAVPLLIGGVLAVLLCCGIGNLKR